MALLAPKPQMSAATTMTGRMNLKVLVNIALVRRGKEIVGWTGEPSLPVCIEANESEVRYE